MVATQIKRWISEDPAFALTLYDRLKSGKIIMRPVDPENKSSMNRFYQSKFTDAGDLLFEFSQLYTNLHELAMDLPEAVAN